MYSGERGGRMDLRGSLVWGFAGTLVLTTILRTSQAAGLTRMDLPLMLGLMVTPNRDKAKVYGFFLHLFNGWVFAFIYAAVFESLGWVSWRLGVVMGSAHAIFVLVVGLPIFPGLHPRMATDGRGPEPTRELEPPGFMAVNYGRETAFVTILAHMIYGAILGTFYRV